MKFTLNELGWSEFFQNEYDKIKNNNITVGRISSQQKNLYHVLGEFGELPATVSGKFRHQTLEKSDFPVVGDWVVLGLLDNGKKGVIQKILSRKTKISRKVAGNRSDEQVISANIDIVFIVTSLNQEFNLHRLDRYLIAVKDGGALPIIVLTKADLVDDASNFTDKIKKRFPGIKNIEVSSFTGKNFDELEKIAEGKTVAVIGSSGVGKSTLINKLINEEKLETQNISFYDRGRHTTTSRELILFKKNSVLIDNPGIKELQFTGEEEIELSDELEFYARQCKFNDCQHKSEPGCAVRKAIEEGRLDPDLLNHFNDLEKEINNARKKIRGRRRDKKTSLKTYS